MSQILRRSFLAVTTLAVLAATAQAAPAKPQTTAAVWQHHIDTWTERDLAGILADYAPDAVMVVNNQVFRGPAEIRGVFVKLFDVFDRVTNHVIDPAIVDGDVVYITWRTTELPFGTDTFVIRDGKIEYQTIASTVDVLRL